MGTKEHNREARRRRRRPHRDDAGHRPRLGGVAVDGVPGPQRRRHDRADRRRHPGACARGRRPARLPAQPAGPRPPRRQDDAARDHRPGDLRPVLRHRRRGGLGAGPGTWLQRRARQRPQRGRTRRSSCTPSSRPATATASSCSATCATSPACSTTSRRRRSPSSPCGPGSTLAGVDTVNVDNRAGVAIGIDHLHALGHRRIGFIGESPHGDVREREAAFVERLTELGVPSTTTSSSPRSPIPGPAPTPSAGCSPRRTRRPRWSRRPTTSPSACSTPPTACGWRSPSRSRSSGSTTSRSPPSPRRP